MEAGIDQALKQEPSQAGSGLPNPTPEQAEQYNLFVNLARKTLFSEQFMEKGKALLQKFPSPVEAMAQIASALAGRIYMEAKKKGDEMDMLVLLYGGVEIVQDVYEFAEAAGADVNVEMVEDTFYRTADLFREMLDKAGMLDRDALAQELEVARQEYGDDFFEEVGGRVNGVMQSNLPQGGAA